MLAERKIKVFQMASKVDSKRVPHWGVHCSEEIFQVDTSHCLTSTRNTHVCITNTAVHLSPFFFLILSTWYKRAMHRHYFWKLKKFSDDCCSVSWGSITAILSAVSQKSGIGDRNGTLFYSKKKEMRIPSTPLRRLRLYTLCRPIRTRHAKLSLSR